MTTERRTQDRRVSPAVGEFAIGECARLRALNKELAQALRGFLWLSDDYAHGNNAASRQLLFNLRDARAALAKVAP